MYPPVFTALSSDAEVRRVLGSHPIRVYPFGQAPDNVADPYCVWQIQGGTPENYLGCRPDMDLFSVQFDVYGTSDTSVREAAKAIRDALEMKCHITAWRGESRDSATKRYRLTFSADWWVPRS